MKTLPALAAALLLAAGPAYAATYTAGPLAAVDPWSRPAPAGATGAGFLTLANHGGGAETLVSIESPAARKVEVHRSSVEGGISRMTPVPRLAVPGGGEVTFAPGGYHLMFMGLTAALKPGERFPATLTFASGRKLEAAFTVSDGMGPPSSGHHH